MGAGLCGSLFELDRFGDRDAILADGGRTGWRELSGRITAAGMGLRDAGVRPGDRVALLGAPSLALVVGTLGVQWAGAIAVPLNPRHRSGELVHVLRDSGATWVCVDDAWRERITALGLPVDLHPLDAPAPVASAAPLPADDEDIALLVYTSGTTGPSKGVALPWRALCRNMLALTEAWAIGPTDVLSLALPLFHVHGLCIGIYGALLRGTTIRLHPRFEPAAVVADFRDHGATWFMGVPTMYVQLLEQLARVPADAEPLMGARLLTAGSAALPPAVLERFEQLTGQRILERYGMTETLITLSNPLLAERRAGTVGLPVAGVEIRIVDDDDVPLPPGEPGELQVRGDSLMRGYWNDEIATAAAFTDGWFRTGDVAIADPDARVRIVGRMSTDIVKSGGFKLSTREIEDVLRGHAGVADVAVIGVADAKWGERVVAVVVPRGEPTALAVLREQLVAHCRVALADYKTPRQLVLLDELPRNAMGKLEKARLRERIERDYGGGGAADVDLRVHTQ
jgi:acyl-CoA synthetase (AMP-forming)/AMP-acid ligase II